VTVAGRMVIVNPSGEHATAWSGLPGRLSVVGDPAEAQAAPYKVLGYSVRVASLRSDHGDGVLALVEDERSLQHVAAAIRGPLPVRDALAELASRPPRRFLLRFGTIPRPARDLRFFQPVIDAEARRGNPGELYFGDSRNEDAGLIFHGPLDGKALAEEFELDDGMELERGENPRLGYSTAGGELAWVLVGRPISVSVAMRELRDAWWQEWRAKPRPPVTLHNPFIHPAALPALPVIRPVILDSVPNGLVIGDEMSTTELLGLGRGWSVWPFTSADGPGLLAVSPYTRAPEMSLPEVLDAGPASVPVLIVVRGQEPPPVAAAMKEAQVEATWPL